MKKKFISLITVIAMMTAFIVMPTIASAAESGSCGENVTWTLEDGVLTISGTGDMEDYNDYNSPWYSSRTSITHVVIEDGVTSIGDFEFYAFSYLANIEIPSSVTSIGDYAFSLCSSLTSIEIPSSVTSIGVYAFWYCSSLTSVIMPSNLTNISDSAFSECSSLTSIVIPSNVTSIGEVAFAECSSLTSIVIPSGITNIGEYAFAGCSSLTSIEIPSNLTSISDSVLSLCDSLTSVIIPSSVTSIGYNAFYCRNLTDVYYAGSESEWNAIAIDDGNHHLTSAAIHFNSSRSTNTSSGSVSTTASSTTTSGTPSSWAVSEVSEALDAGLVTSSVSKNYQSNITREQFCEMVVLAYEKISGETAETGTVSFNDTSNAEILKAANLGIVNGVGGGSFAPNDYITRQEIATMLVRMIDVASSYANVNVYNSNKFADSGSIDSWALPSINYAYDNGIMQGVGGNMIAPLDNTTCEEAVLLVYRTYKKYCNIDNPDDYENDITDETTDDDMDDIADDDTNENEELFEEYGYIPFEKSDTDDYETYYVYANGYNVYQDSTGIYVDGQIIDSDADWNFIFNGYTLYYSYDGNIYHTDIETLETEFILSCEDVFLEGCYDNQFLYYTTWEYNEEVPSLVIYDLYEQEAVAIVEDVNTVEVGEYCILVEPMSGEITGLPVTQMDVNGDNSKIIIDDAFSMKIIGDTLYYEAVEWDSDLGYEVTMKAYNVDTEETTTLTDTYINTYVTTITAEYATFVDMESGDTFDIYYE